jgi:hypothetical protein
MIFKSPWLALEEKVIIWKQMVPLIGCTGSFIKIVQGSLVKSVDNSQIRKEEYGSTEDNFVIDWQFKMRSILENLLIIIGRMHIINQRVVFEIIQEVEWFVKLFHNKASNVIL